MIVLAKKLSDSEFVKWGGRYNDTPVMKEVWKPVALVWSSDNTDIDRAEKFATQEGYSMYILPDTPDVLAIAKGKIMEEC